MGLTGSGKYFGELKKELHSSLKLAVFQTDLNSKPVHRPLETSNLMGS